MTADMPQITIHRGARQIGGCVTEISTERSRVFIDFGENLSGNDADLPLIDGLNTGNSKNSALFLTHYHGDHIGRIGDALPGIPVYMGRTAKEIQLNLVERIDRGRLSLYEKIKTFIPLTKITIGDIVVTPFMIDHSAFDAYMFLIEADGRRVLHTGDFRFHGFRGNKTLKMLKYYAKDVDYIICEGTTISRTGEPAMTERELQREAAAMMKKTKNVFVMCSSTNIDRIGAFYYANPQGRPFVCDGYQKKQLETVRLNHARMSRFYDFQKIYEYTPSEKLNKYMEDRGFCMLVRQGEYFRRIMERYKNNCLVIYSMWKGYLDERASNRGLADFFAPYKYHALHAGGHASPEDIKKLRDTVKPKCGFIPIHTDAPEKFQELMPEGTIIILNDGEVRNL